MSKLVGAVAFGTALVASAVRIRPLSGLHAGLGLFAVWMTATLLWSINPEATTTKVLSLWQLMAMVWLLWQFSEHRTDQLLLFKAYVLGAQLSAGVTVINYLRGTASLDASRYVAGEFNPNELALTIALSVPMAIYLSNQRAGLAAWYYRLHLGLAATAIVLTGSRGAFLAFVVASSYLLLSIRYARLAHRVWLIAAAAVSVAVIVSIVPANSWKRLGTIQNEVAGGSLTMRRTIWKAALQVYERQPVQGIGAGSTPRAIGPLIGRELVAHNTFLSILVEGGAIGVALFSSMLLSLVVAALRMAPAERALWLVLLAAWGLGVTAATWEYLKPTWFLFALLISQFAHARFVEKAQRMARSAADLATAPYSYVRIV